MKLNEARKRVFTAKDSYLAEGQVAMSKISKVKSWKGVIDDTQVQELKKIVGQWDKFWKSIPDDRKQHYNF